MSKKNPPSIRQTAKARVRCGDDIMYVPIGGGLPENECVTEKELN